MINTELKRKEITGENFSIRINNFSEELTNYIITSDLTITGQDLNSRYINIKNCVFSGEINLKGLNNITLHFSNCIFDQRFLLVNSFIQNLHLSNCIFKQYFSFKNLNIDYFSIRDCSFDIEKNLVIDQFSAVKFEFRNNESNYDINITPKKLNECFLLGSISKINVTLSNKGSQEIIEQLRINTSSIVKTDFLIRNIKVRNFHLFGELKDSTLILGNLDVFSGVINHFANNGKLTFHSIRPLNENSLIVLKNSSLGNASIGNTDFALFSKVKISNCNLIDIVPVNVSWCLSNLEKESNLLQRENFRQLKIIGSKNDDIISKLHFQKLEFRTLKHVLKETNGNLLDRFILNINYLSNDFGQNFFLALIWILGISLLWYTCIKYSLDQTEFSSTLILGEIGDFLNFINPAHKFESVFHMEKNYKGTALFFDALGRITSLYLLYQFISAFRKFSKK